MRGRRLQLPKGLPPRSSHGSVNLVAGVKMSSGKHGTRGAVEPYLRLGARVQRRSWAWFSWDSVPLVAGDGVGPPSLSCSWERERTPVSEGITLCRVATHLSEATVPAWW